MRVKNGKDRNLRRWVTKPFSQSYFYLWLIQKSFNEIWTRILKYLRSFFIFCVGFILSIQVLEGDGNSDSWSVFQKWHLNFRAQLLREVATNNDQFLTCDHFIIQMSFWPFNSYRSVDTSSIKNYNYRHLATKMFVSNTILAAAFRNRAIIGYLRVPVNRFIKIVFNLILI